MALSWHLISLLTNHTVEVDNFSTLSYMFQMIMAAKHGFVTINIDPRGQSGYGRKFSEANWEQPGKPQVEDLEDLVDLFLDPAGKHGLGGIVLNKAVYKKFAAFFLLHLGK